MCWCSVDLTSTFFDCCRTVHRAVHLCFMQGAFEVSVGWASALTQYPGILYDSSKAGFPPELSNNDFLTAAENAAPIQKTIGAVYYPGQTVTLDE